MNAITHVALDRVGCILGGESATIDRRDVVEVDATYRDVEVDRSHPLSGALAELSRIASFSRVRLRGLTAEEVQRMLSSLAAEEIGWA